MCCWLHMIYVPVFSRFSLLQGLVCVPEKFETGELKPPLYRAHPLDLLRQENGGVGPDPTEVFAHEGIIVS